MRRCAGFHWPLLAGLLLLSFPAARSWAVTISLIPDGPTTIEVGVVVNVDVFMVLDAADQVAGIGAATVHFEIRTPVAMVPSSDGSVFPNALANVTYREDEFLSFSHFHPSVTGIAVFSQFGSTVTSPTALLGSFRITGQAPGSFDLRTSNYIDPLSEEPRFPLFTAPLSSVNRFDFASDETLRITVICAFGACPSGISPTPIDAPAVPEPHTLTLLGMALAALMWLRRRSVSG